MSYNYSGVPPAPINPMMSNMGIGPSGPMMAGGPQSFMNPMLANQPPSGNMLLPAGPGMNDSPLEFNVNKNNPPMPLETSNSRTGSEEDYSNGKNDMRRDRNRRNDRRERERREDRRNSRDRDRARDKDTRRGSSEDPPSSTSSNTITRPTDPSTSVNPGMWSGMMGMGYPMMGMIMDPTNMMSMNNYGAMMQPILQPDGTILPVDPTTMDSMLPPAGPIVKEIIHCKSCTLYPPAPTAPAPTTRERPPGCRTVFVGGLPENMTEEIITEVFEKCGEITTLRLSKKNFCHIRFMYESSVDAAIYLSGYRIRIGNNSDPPNSGRLHVDYAQARDDQYEWECKQRAIMREQRHRERMEEERLRPPSPPPVQHYTEHEAATVADKIKADETFPKAVQIIITWLERGDCNKRNSNTFYSMIQSTNSHVRRLLAEKTQYEEELQKAKEIMKGRMQGILIQFGQIERVFAAASHKKVWDHFTKAQRKNIDMWKKQTQEIKTVQLEDVFNERADEEMDVSDNDDNESSPPRKKQRVADTTSDEKSHLKEENDSLRCQLEAYKNEVDIVRSELQASLDTKEKQLQMLQQTLKGMQKQLLDSIKKQTEDDAKVKDLQALLDSQKSQDKECTIIDLDASDSPTLTKSDECQNINVVTPSTTPPVVDRDAKLIGLISIFLHVHPFGAGVDYIWSYLQKLESSLKPSDVENLMSKFPTLFRQELSGIGANMERRWQFIGFQQSPSGSNNT